MTRLWKESKALASCACSILRTIRRACMIRRAFSALTDSERAFLLSSTDDCALSRSKDNCCFAAAIDSHRDAAMHSSHRSHADSRPGVLQKLMALFIAP